MCDSPSTPIKKRSIIYEYFTEDKDASKYICNHCQLPVAAKARTSNLIAHLQITNHEEVYQKYLNAAVERDNSNNLLKWIGKKRKQLIFTSNQPSILSKLTPSYPINSHMHKTR